jgi:hypothetical protein
MSGCACPPFYNSRKAAFDMNTPLPSQNDGSYWYPFRPSLRWPVRILGLAGVLASLGHWSLGSHWHWQGLLMPLWFLIISFETPYRRRKTASYHVIIAALIAIPLLLLLFYFVASRA